MTIRILRLYLSSENHTDEHKILEFFFLLKSYIIVWFSIKKSKYFTKRPANVLKIINSSIFFPKNMLKFIDPVTERNTFLSLPENLVLNMIIDKRDHTKELGFTIIIKVRNLVSKSMSSRCFKPPKSIF